MDGIDTFPNERTGACQGVRPFLTLQGLLDAFSLTALLKMFKWDYKVWDASLSSRINPGPHNSACSSLFEFLHSLGQK
jgi:hypothetical protein